MMKTRKLFQLACRQSPFDLRLHPMRLPTARPMTTFGVFDDKEKAAETRYVKEKEKEYLQYRREEKIIAQKKELQLILGEGLFEACEKAGCGSGEKSIIERLIDWKHAS